MAHVLIIENGQECITARCECNNVKFSHFNTSLMSFTGETREIWFENVIDLHRKHVRSINGLNTVLHDNERFLYNLQSDP